jgi:pimeloyl-ACP methyl ester carboxylesterase
MAEAVSTVGAPARLLLWTEPGRATAELGSFVFAAPLLRRAPRGDGHQVLVLPGFMADDRSTIALRLFLRQLGYWAEPWGLGRNLGPSRAILTGMADRLAQMTDETGRPVSLVGWSLGGMYARGLARDLPALVRQVVTLGSPYRDARPIGSHVTRRFERLARHHVPFSELPPPESDRDPLGVPSTAVYTRADGIVSWRSCLQGEGPRRENVEVVGSHCGLGHNPAALWVVADRLAQPAGTWSPFRPPALLRALFPAPAVHAPPAVVA